MKKIYLLIFILGYVIVGRAQISCTNEIASDTTAYTNGVPNDSIFFVCAGQTASLIADPPSGTPGWDFVWQQFNVAGNIWLPLATQTDVPNGSQTAGPGGYRVTIFDGGDVNVGSYVVWVCRINTNPTVNVNPISPGCGNVQLTGTIANGSITPYYNTPVAFDPNQALIITAETVISICFTAEHSFISDLAFHLVGPPSCGSPDILLAPSPGVCNGCCTNGDNNPDVNNLCFSTEATNTLNMCSFSPNPATGTYGAYGAGATPINWAPLIGCDASQTGWAVQIYDCVGADIGSLTDASLSFSGLSVGGDPITYSYTTPSGFSSGIADNSCTAGSASIFSVPSPPAVPINFNYSYIWTADPPFTIPNNTTSLNILLNPGPTVDTQFTLELLGTNPGAVCGGTSSDTELFDYIQPGESMIEPVAPSYCEQELPFDLISDQTSGTWSGAGITNINLGTFSPAVSGAGTWTITFMPSTACVNSSTIDITVVEQPVASITGIPVLCSSAAPFDLAADYPGGIWTGTGITDSIMGTFDPAIAATEGTVSINYFIDGACPIQGNTDINVVEQEPLQLSAPQDVLCIDGTSINLTANIPNGTWTGTGITEQAFGLFDPATAGLGSWSITYTYNEVCFDESQITIEVIDSSLVLTMQPLLCVTSDPVNLEASYPGGIWSGNGITDPSGGLFDPASIGVAGSYTVYYFSNNACNAVDSMSIELQGVPSVSITIPASVCEESMVLNLDADVDGGTWSGDGIIDATMGLFNPGAAGAGPAVITYTLAGICESTDSGTIQVNPTPALNAGTDVAICYNESVSMNATGAAVYSWSPVSGLSSGAVANPVADPNNTTTYTVTGLSAFGCSAQDQVVVTVYPEPNVIVNGPFTVCQGDVVQLQASGMDSYIWTGSGISSNLISNPTATPTETTTYTVIGQDSNGCDGSATIVVNVTQPVSYFVASTYEGMSPLEVTFDNNSVGDSFEWDFGNGSTLNTTDPNLNPTEEFVGEGTYTVTLTTIENGCPEDYSVNIFVFYDSAILTVPNVVTMNGDSQNDNFEISTRNMRTMDVQIFDRWGKNLGSIDRPNGAWSPREFGTGTYYFVLKAEGYDNEKYDQAGFFTVLE